MFRQVTNMKISDLASTEPIDDFPTLTFLSGFFVGIQSYFDSIS